MKTSVLGALALLGALTSSSFAQTPLDRGKYLVVVGGCSDCHTPGNFLGHPDFKRYLGGSDVGFAMPRVGVFYGRNLTPDKETGLGGWSEDEIVTAITTGKRPDGRTLAPVMPWPAFAQLTPDDAMAIALYLKSLPPISNRVPGPFRADETPTGLVMTIVPGDVYAKMPLPPK